MAESKKTGAGRVTAGATVVLDNVSMRYRVRSTEPVSSMDPKAPRAFARWLGDRKKISVHALSSLSLVVERGESIGIIGRNGSGKSTLMRIIAGQAQPSTGAVYASSQPILLGVNAALVPELSGDQNIILGCLAMGMTRKQVNLKYESIVDLSGLGRAVHLPMKSYSSGMSSRLRFAIASAIDPEILLIDEALNTGDAQFRDRSKRRMDDLRQNAGTVFLVSHSLDTITDICTRALWLDQGELLMDGDPAAVTKSYRSFTWLLSKKKFASAAKWRAEARGRLVATEVLERFSGRRSA